MSGDDGVGDDRLTDEKFAPTGHDIWQDERLRGLEQNVNELNRNLESLRRTVQDLAAQVHSPPAHVVEQIVACVNASEEVASRMRRIVADEVRRARDRRPRRKQESEDAKRGDAGD